MADYKTPGVYIEEISQLAPTAAEVPTAIPAFIGYTEKAMKSGTNVSKVPVYINSLLEYKNYFGGDYSHKTIDVLLDDDKNITDVKFDKEFYLFNSVRMFFANGGGQCCIVSMGKYNDDDINKEVLEEGIGIVKRENLPTIIIIPEAVLLPTNEECYAVQQQALMMCAKLKDRVIVLDIYDGYKAMDDVDDVIANFRTGIGINGLPFGAAYYPWLQTLYTTNFSYKNVVFKNDKKQTVKLEELVANPIQIENLNSSIADLDTIKGFNSDPIGQGKLFKIMFFKVDKKIENKKGELVHQIELLKKAATNLIDLRDKKLQNDTVKSELKQKTNKTSLFASIIQSLYSVDTGIKGTGFDPKKDFTEYGLSKIQPNSDLIAVKDERELIALAKPMLKSLFHSFGKFLSTVKQDAIDIEKHYDKAVYENVELYKIAVNKIYEKSAVLPPSGAIAGIYSQVDGSRGVWKAPANVSVSNIVKPLAKVDNDQQENLNVDTIGGKSVNAIRTFQGQGTLVWGARTLAGNDNEWRYISVRRFFNMAEKTLKQSSAWAVFEPNVEMTWVRIKAMMNNFLTNLWKAGALVGGTPDEAFFVNIGLGSTMTQVDILEGKMIIEVGMAVVRPAEFIIIKFSHKVGGTEGGEEGGE